MKFSRRARPAAAPSWSRDPRTGAARARDQRRRGRAVHWSRSTSLHRDDRESRASSSREGADAIVCRKLPWPRRDQRERRRWVHFCDGPRLARGRHPPTSRNSGYRNPLSAAPPNDRTAGMTGDLTTQVIGMGKKGEADSAAFVTGLERQAATRAIRRRRFLPLERVAVGDRRTEGLRDRISPCAVGPGLEQARPARSGADQQSPSAEYSHHEYLSPYPF